MEEKPISVILAQRLFYSFLGNSVHSQEVIYRELKEIANELKIGDRLEFPDGTTFVCMFKPSVKKENVVEIEKKDFDIIMNFLEIAWGETANMNVDTVNDILLKYKEK